MDIQAFANLFKGYCSNYLYKEFVDATARPLYFLHYDMEELTAVLREITLPAFFLSTPEVDFGGENEDSTHESYEGTFMVLLQLPSGDITKKGEVVQQAKTICDDFIRRMMYDVRATDLMDGLNVSGIKAGVVGRTADNLYGWTVSFNIVQGFDGELKTNVWEDLN